MSASSRLFTVLYRPAVLASASCALAHSNCNGEGEKSGSTSRVGVFAVCSLAQRAYCEELVEPKPPNKNLNEWKGDSFPNLTRHGQNSMLREFLTREVYEQLKDKKTASGVTLEDLIRAGVCLPYGANPPHGIAGVYAGDAESYTTFGALLNPIIKKHHKAANRVRLQRFRTNLNPGGLLQRRLDPKGEYILYTRMRLARSLAGFRFAPCVERGERRQIEQLFRDCVSDWKEGKYVSVMDMTNKQHDELVRRQFLFTDPDDYTVSAGLARDWPDARGIYCDTWDETPNLIIWCNAADHIWIISNAKGGDVQGVFTRMSKAVWALETSLKQRGHGFVEDSRLGFLNTCPADIGTALRASVYIKLIRLGQHKGFEDLMRRLHLEARAHEYSQSDNKRYTGIFDIGNAEALGKTEVQLINIMIHGVAICIDLERRLENGEKLNLAEVDVSSEA
jgi:creatine kinase